MTLGPTGHIDSFTRDRLPPAGQWPDLPRAGFAYPDWLNAGVELTDAMVAKGFGDHTALIGNGAATSIAVTHSFGNQWVTAQVFEVATLSQVECDVVLTDSNTTTFIFAVAPASSAMRVVIIG